MFNIRNTLVLRDLNAVTNYLKKNTHKTFIKDIRPFWPNVGKNILVQHSIIKQLHSITIWNTNMFTSEMTEDMNSLSYFLPNSNTKSNFIGALDYYINKDRLKLDYFKATTEQVRSGLLKYAENNAKECNINKLIIEVHGNNIEKYNEFYKKYNFYPNGKVCRPNPFFVEIEKKI